MSPLNTIMEPISPFFPLLVTISAVGVMLWAAYWIFIGRHHDLGNERLFFRQLILVGVTLAGVVVIVLALPLDEGARAQIVGLIGLVISGIIAFSSGNIFTNLAAGIVLRVTRPFGIGDFIRVRDYFGRVTERGLFDTEIQAENRELIAIPNSYLTSNPVSTIRSSGAIVSASLSLGYDVHHSQVSSLLIQAAEKSGLEEAFVHILDLGNYSITYRISGILPDVKGIITARSNLYRDILDVLHGHGIEIMSPSFMNQRQLAQGKRFIPTPEIETPSEQKAVAEDVVFDKAEEAAQLDHEQLELIDKIKQLKIELVQASDEEKAHIKKEIEALGGRLEIIEQKASGSTEDTIMAEHSSLGKG